MSGLYHHPQFSTQSSGDYKTPNGFIKYAKKQPLHSDAQARKNRNRMQTIPDIERNLQDQLIRVSKKDYDHFRHIRSIFQKALPDETGSLKPGVQVGVSQENFENVLALMDVNATKEQAAQIFQKYDSNQNGRLTAYEFLQNVRLISTDTSVHQWNKEHIKITKGKRIGYAERGLADARPSSALAASLSAQELALRSSDLSLPPSAAANRMSMQSMAQSLRAKFEQKSNRKSFKSCRNQLNRCFSFHDPKRQGSVSAKDLQIVLKHLNYNIGDENAKALFREFNSNDGKFDYQGFSSFVFPHGVDDTHNTSLAIGDTFYERQAKDRSLSNTQSQGYLGTDQPSFPLSLSRSQSMSMASRPQSAHPYNTSPQLQGDQRGFVDSRLSQARDQSMFAPSPNNPNKPLTPYKLDHDDNDNSNTPKHPKARPPSRPVTARYLNSRTNSPSPRNAYLLRTRTPVFSKKPSNKGFNIITSNNKQQQTQKIQQHEHNRSGQVSPYVSQHAQQQRNFKQQSKKEREMERFARQSRNSGSRAQTPLAVPRVPTPQSARSSRGPSRRSSSRMSARSRVSNRPTSRGYYQSFYY